MKLPKLSELTLEQKVGQMLCFAFHGTNYNDQLEQLLKEIEVGGVIFFARNIIDVKQVTTLNMDIQRNSKIPVFSSIDQEGGTVQRITKGITSFPGAMALAATNEERDIYELTKSVGNDLSKLGFSIVHAPVADVNNNSSNPVINSRAYSDDPKVVSNYVNLAYKGFQDGGILPTIKHFPGHGDTDTDSHLQMPTVSKTKEEIEKIEIYPFKKAIEMGCDGIMVGHIKYPSYDDEYPASLSYNIMTKLLKEKLGFSGLIVTDSLTMGAINCNYSKRDIVKLCVNGGGDMLIFCGTANINEQVMIYHEFIDLVKTKEIPLSRIDYSVNKILKYKEKYLNRVLKENLSDLAINDELGKTLSLKSISKVIESKDDFCTIKNTDKVVIIFPKIKLFSLVDNELEKYMTLGSVLGNQYKEIIISDEETISNEEASYINNYYDKIIFATYNITKEKDDYQVMTFNKLSKDKTIVISLRSPYDIINLDGAKNYICVYEATELSLNSLAKVLRGEFPFRGMIPVKIKGV